MPRSHRGTGVSPVNDWAVGSLAIAYCCEQSSQNGQILRHGGRRFGVQPSGCTDRDRLKPELQTCRAQRMPRRYEDRSLLIAPGQAAPVYRPWSFWGIGDFAETVSLPFAP